VREISFPVPEKVLSPPIIAVDDVSVGLRSQKTGASSRDAADRHDDRIALLGSNGKGKSTLSADCQQTGAVFPVTSPREKLSVGYFAQHQVDELISTARPTTRSQADAGCH